MDNFIKGTASTLLECGLDKVTYSKEQVKGMDRHAQPIDSAVENMVIIVNKPKACPAIFKLLNYLVIIHKLKNFGGGGHV